MMKSTFTLTTLCAAVLLCCASYVALSARATPSDSALQSEGFECLLKEPSPPPETKLDLGDVTNKALQLPAPRYPGLAKTSGVDRNVKAEVVVDINSGRVVWAKIISGQPLLKAAVSDVVCKARFAPTYDVDGFVSGALIYRFARLR